MSCNNCLHRDVCYRKEQIHEYPEKDCYDYDFSGEMPPTELIPLNPDNRGYTDLFKCVKCGAYIHIPYTDSIDYRFCPYCGEKVKEG